MKKRHEILWSVGGILIFLFFLGACGKKEEAPEKPKVVSKKIVSKKVSKPIPKKVKKSQADAPAKQGVKIDSKGAPTPKKSLEAPEQAKEKTDNDDKKEVSTTTLAAKKKPAFKPKSEISTQNDYKKTSADALKVAKKQDAKVSDSIKKSASEKVDSAKADKGAKPELKEKTIKKPGTVEKSAKTAKDDVVKDKDPDKDKQKDLVSTSKEKKESLSAEEKESGEKSESESVAKLTPSKTLESVKIEPLTQDYKYNPAGRIDPFSSLFKVKSESQKKKRKRFPLTPLEKKDISQFKLVGIILSAKGNKAIVKEASGKGYVISKGTYIGVNDGRVIKILKDKVICEEEVENLFGQIQTKSRIIKLKKPPGAL